MSKDPKIGVDLKGKNIMTFCHNTFLSKPNYLDNGCF